MKFLSIIIICVLIEINLYCSLIGFISRFWKKLERRKKEMHLSKKLLRYWRIVRPVCLLKYVNI